MTHPQVTSTTPEMAARIRDFDWASTPVGPRENWPVSLRVLTEMLLAHPYAMVVLWGDGLIQLYNDAYRLLMGHKHPAGLGQATRECWPEVWTFNAPIYAEVLRGQSFEFSDQPLTIHRHGHEEQAYFTLSYSPVCGDDGEAGGVLVTVIETTANVLTRQEADRHRTEIERRNATLEAFAVLTRDLALDTEPLPLIRRVQEAVLTLLEAGFSQYYELENGVWHVRSRVGQVNTPELQAILDAGLSFEDTPNLLIPWRSGKLHYQDVCDPTADRLSGSAAYPQATVTLPVRVGSRTLGVLGFALSELRQWSSADRAVLETVERSLTLALERAEQTRYAEQQRLALKRRTAALQEANEELEAFAYSVSHDLRTPVRHIRGFSQLLRTVVPTTDPKTAHYLTVIDDAATRMYALIDALLDLSRTARAPLRLGPVDLGAVVTRVQQDLEMDVQGRQVQWQIAPLPLVQGDHDTLHQAVTNLLSNALKYTRPRETAVIEVWAEERADEWAVFVRDNGVGFDPRYRNKLFGVFQRLHSERDFDGTGVGLANVRRIVQRHGGRVTAHGALGAGATFGFTVPH